MKYRKEAFVILSFCLFLIIASKFGWLKDRELNAIAITVSGSIAIWTWNKGRENEQELKRRDIRLGYLINVYRQIAMGVARDPENEKNFELQKNLEEAIAMIQLYGTKEEIDKLHLILGQNAPFDPLLKSLRNRLRKELNLELTDTDAIPFRTAKELKGIQEFLEKQKKI